MLFFKIKHKYNVALIAVISAIVMQSKTASAECDPTIHIYDEPGLYNIDVPQGCNLIEIAAWGGGGGAGDFHDAEIQGGSQSFPGGNGGGAGYVYLKDSIASGTPIEIGVGCGGPNGVVYEKPSEIISSLGLQQSFISGLPIDPINDDEPIRLGRSGSGGRASTVYFGDEIAIIAPGGGGGGAAQRWGRGGDATAGDTSILRAESGQGQNGAPGGLISLGFSGGEGAYAVSGTSGTDGDSTCGGDGGASVGIGGEGGQGGCGFYGGGGGAGGAGQCQVSLDGMPICQSGAGGGGGGGTGLVHTFGVSTVETEAGDGILVGGTESELWNGTAGMGGASLDDNGEPENGNDGMVAVRFYGVDLQQYYWQYGNNR